MSLTLLSAPPATDTPLPRNLLGQRMAAEPLPHAGTGEVRLSVQHLPAGFYTGALEVGGHRQASHKLTVAH